MKRWSSRSNPPPPERRPEQRAPRRVLLALCLAALASNACVTMGRFQEVVDERDALAERVRRLEASNESLNAERIEVLEALETLREERIRLAREVEQLRAERERLRTDLRKTSAELARQAREVARLRGTYEALVSDLEAEVAAGEVQIQQLREGLRVGVSDAILFPPGSARLDARGRDVLTRVAEQLQKLPGEVIVEGHTDDLPIRGALRQRYPTNWELAGARAARVVRLFEQVGIDPHRLAAVSYASYRPIAPNDSPENRARNRRIEIRVIPKDRPITQGAPEAAAGEASAGTP